MRRRVLLVAVHGDFAHSPVSRTRSAIRSNDSAGSYRTASVSAAIASIWPISASDAAFSSFLHRSQLPSTILYPGDKETVDKKTKALFLEIMREIGSKGGKIGGKRSLETMTPEEGSARAKKASEAAAKKRKEKRLASERKGKTAKAKRF